jgi:6-phosphofructokinase 1
MKTIAVLTSGGDAPGMNACLRAVVRTALSHGVQTYGVKRGYAGLCAGEIEPLTSRAVGGIARWGGTILQTFRSEEFKTTEGFWNAIENIRRFEIEGLVVIGGDGSLRGALELHKAGIPCIGVPASIDNDIYGTDLSIGVDTATNTILDAIDKIKDTASALQRAFVIEVMGRRCGYLALAAGVAGGAEMIIVPERPTSIEEITQEIVRARRRGKPHFIVVVAEGAKPTAAEICNALIDMKTQGFEARLTVLGHVQRGGSPTAFDRLLATRFGTAAVEALLEGKSGLMVAQRGTDTITIPLEEALSRQRPVDEELLKLEEALAL